MTDTSILEMKGVRKSFGTVVALQDVDLSLNAKEIRGLLGGNGAGKTTLMNVLYGLYRPDAGEISIHGTPVDIQSPKDAIRHGIGMVHQHFLQVDNFTVLQNIVLGTSLKNRPALNLQAEEAKVRELAERFGLEVDPRTVIEDLPIGTRQKVEILKALYRGVEVLILDEPTTNLTPQEVDSLFQSLRVMVDAGMSVVFITHKIREALDVCDSISVLRDGRNVFTVPRNEASEDVLVKGMVGEKLDVEASLLFSAEGPSERASVAGDTPLLQVDRLAVHGEGGVFAVHDCTFQVHKGEIFGIAGVAGNGQRELAESLIGIRPIVRGHAAIDGVNVAETDTEHLLERGVTYIPEDRLHDGFLPAANVAQNLILGYHRQEPYSEGGFLDWKAIFRTARELILEYDIRTPGPGATAANLSGGNIQRMMLARAFSRPAKLLVAHNPTRGLDIPSTEFVYEKLLEQRQQGAATLLLSEDLDELLLLCDRIAAIYRGEIVGALKQDEFDKYALGRMMGGVEKGE